jgi:hypothetical protein
LLLVLALWVGVSGAASVPAAPASVQGAAPAGATDLQARLLDLLGGVGICGDDESDADDVLCGGDLLAGLVSDPAVLLMSRGTCSRLLEQLYNRQVCESEREDCGELRHGNLPPPQGPRLAPSPSAGLLAQRNAELAPLLARTRVARPRDDPDPTSHTLRPAAPPPRSVPA